MRCKYTINRVLFSFILIISISSILKPQTDLDPPEFSPGRGFYDESFDLIITAPEGIENASIVYTLDCSDPINNSNAYEVLSPATIHIDPDDVTGRASTPAVVVRAYAKVNDTIITSVGTNTYIFIEKVKNQTYPGGNWPVGPVNTKILDYDMDPDVVNDVRYKDLIDDALLEIPSICINTDMKNLFDPQIGIYVNPTGRGIEWERPTSIELIDPHKKEPGFQVNGGIRIRGGYSRIPEYENGQYKHAFRLFFRNEYGEGKLKYPLFGNEGVSKFDNVDLRTSQNYSWSYQGYSSHVCIFVRELFSRDCQRDMGEPYTRSRHYQLYLNGMYWGLYQTQERSEASYAESYFGGDKSNYDVVKPDPTAGGRIEATDGTLDAFNQLWSLTKSGTPTNEAYFKVQGKNPDGSDNINYPVLCNVDNLIDYLLIIYYTGNFDAPVTAFSGNSSPNNFYGIYNRLGRDGFLFFAHDAEHSLMDPQYTEAWWGEYGLDRTGPFGGGSQMQTNNPQWIHQKLSDNIEYRVKFSDHIYKHFFNDGVLTAQKSQQRLAARTAEIDTAVIAESARWGDAKVNPPRTKDDDWEPAVSWIMNSFFPNRTGIVLQQLKNDNLYPSIDPPVFYNNVTEIIAQTLDVQPGYKLKLTNPNANGTIQYTIDGKDPRNIGGDISGTSNDGGNEIEITVNSTTVIKARIQNGTTWSAIHEIILFAGNDISDLKVTEIHYHPEDKDSILDDDNDYEFLELKNIGTTPINISQAFFDDGINYTFPDGAIVNPGEFIVLGSNSEKFNERYGFLPFGEYSGQLDNGGERITLLTANNDTIFSILYDDEAPWPWTPDTFGYSLVPIEINPTGDLNDPANWRASYTINGSPGSDDLPTSVENPEMEIPDDFKLYQNYPNPFNPSTTISYQLPAGSLVTLRIYDVLGREVTTLINEFQNAGTYKIDFNRQQTTNNIQLSSGIYFYRLQTAENTITKKMILLK